MLKSIWNTGSFLQSCIFVACNLAANISASRCLAKGFGSMFALSNNGKQCSHRWL